MKRMSLIGIRNKYNPAEAPKKVKGLNRQKGWKPYQPWLKVQLYIFLKPRYCEKLQYPFFS